MKFREFGEDKTQVILLLHGGGLNWWNYREEAELLQSDYHVILPILDGHAGSDRPFSSIEDNASEITDFIDEKLGGKVLLIGGLSLGAQVLLEILSQRKDICQFALVESAAVIPSKLTNSLIGPSVRSSYGLIKNRGFAKLQFRSLHMKDDLFEDYYRDTCAITKADMIAFLKANTSYSLKKGIRDCSAKVEVFAGDRETKEILKSVEVLKEGIPGCHVSLIPGLYHGEFSINHADDYVRTVRSMLCTEKE